MCVLDIDSCMSVMCRYMWIDEGTMERRERERTGGMEGGKERGRERSTDDVGGACCSVLELAWIVM